MSVLKQIKPVQDTVKKLELTLAILKPHVVENARSATEIKNILLRADFKIVRSKRAVLTLQETSGLFNQKGNKPMDGDLTAQITKGPSDIMILAKANAIEHWRSFTGPWSVYKNAVTGSSCREKIGQFFPDFDYDKWYENEEVHFRNNNVYFVSKEFVHKLNHDVVSESITQKYSKI